MAGGSPPGLSGSLRLMQHFSYEPVGLSAFFGGMSIDRKLSTKSPQFYYARHIDFRKNPGQFTVLPQGAAETSGNVTDLLLDMDQIGTGVRYSVGNTGNVYRTATNGTFSLYGNLGENSGAGLKYRSDVDHTYISGQSSIIRIKRTANAPQFQPAWFQHGISTSSTCSKSGGTNTYTPKAVITETATDMRTFTSDIEPLYQIGIHIVTKGTGDYTLTLHNDANDVLGTVTITNANLKSGGVTYFIFSAPIRIQRGDNGGGSALTYHFHLTSTVADGVIATTTAGSLADCDMELWANPLVITNNGLHPITNFLNYTLIGNGNYVAQYEPLQDSPEMNIDYLPHRLTLPPGFEVCGIAQKNLLCVIGAEKRSTTGEFQEGVLIFWDGVSQTYNDWWPVEEGSPETLYSHNNTVFYIAGGALYEIDGTDQPIKRRVFRNTDSEFSSIADTTHVYPNMMAVRRGILVMGYPSYTTNTALEHAVFSWGQNTSDYPISFGLNYSPSTGTAYNNGSNNLKIGMVKSFGDTLYVSWRDDSAAKTYGVDVTDNTALPAVTATIESILHDGGRPAYFKKAAYILAVTEALPADCSYVLKYKINREANWHYSTDLDATNFASGGSTYFVFPIPDSSTRYLQIEHGMDLTNGTTTPVVLFLGVFVDLLLLERPIGAGT